MNLRYLGDALDHWKGSVLERFESDGVARDVKVVPMFTNDLPTAEQVALYANLLRRKDPGGVLLGHARFPGRKRSQYFASADDLSGSADLFLDPDTGVGPGGRKHVSGGDMNKAGLLDGQRLVLVYQHVDGRDHELLNRLGTAADDAEAAAAGLLRCGQVGMLFVSKDITRVSAVMGAAEEWMGPEAKRRVLRIR